MQAKRIGISLAAFLSLLFAFTSLRVNEKKGFPLLATSTPQRETAHIASKALPVNLFYVARVIDGDTIELPNGQYVRYIGMDTPETVDPREPAQCFGEEAAQRNRELVEGKDIRLEKDVEDKDTYGRLLRYVFVGDPSTRFPRPEPFGGEPQDEPLGTKAGQDIFVNLELVREGYARAYTVPPNVKYQDEFLAAEREAREEKRGLWSKCVK